MKHEIDKIAPTGAPGWLNGCAPGEASPARRREPSRLCARVAEASPLGGPGPCAGYRLVYMATTPDGSQGMIWEEIKFEAGCKPKDRAKLNARLKGLRRAVGMGASSPLSEWVGRRLVLVCKRHGGKKAPRYEIIGHEPPAKEAPGELFNEGANDHE